MREKERRKIMKAARRSEKQLRRFLEQQSGGLTDEEMADFRTEALAHADDVAGEEINDENYSAKYAVGLNKMRNRRS